jgi:DNA-binding MarR family transcriptional regulator
MSNATSRVKSAKEPAPQLTNALDTSAQKNFPFGVAPRHELSMALRRAYMRLHRDTCARCAEENITADQFVLMNVVNSAGSAKQSTLVELVDSDANTISAMLRRLQHRGLICREKHPVDLRANTVQLTEKGSQLLAILEQKTMANRSDMEHAFSPEELENLISLLRRLATHSHHDDSE